MMELVSDNLLKRLFLDGMPNWPIRSGLILGPGKMANDW